MSPVVGGVLSIVIPSYNSAQWLPATLNALAVAVRHAEADVEVVVVDDGSDDESRDVVERLADQFPGVLTVLRQDNSGRFLARWTGIQRATGEYILLLDSRVILAPDALSYLLGSIDRDVVPAGWNAHVHTDGGAPLIGRFWEVPTFVFWGQYLHDPRPDLRTGATFDTAPKGTGAFLARKDVLIAAFQAAWPEGDAKLISDDTKILRWIADNGGIRLDPGFSATYLPRATVRGFVRHSFDRGTLFVDSYAGTSTLRSIILLGAAIGPLLAIAIVVWLTVAGSGVAALTVAVFLVLLLLVPLVPATFNRCPPRALASYSTFILVFLVPFWSGLIRGVVIHRGAFVDRSRFAGTTAGKAHS